MLARRASKGLSSEQVSTHCTSALRTLGWLCVERLRLPDHAVVGSSAVVQRRNGCPS